MKLLPTLLIASTLVGCSSINGLTDVTNLVDYRNHKSVKMLQIPSDLDAPIFDKTYVTTVSDKITSERSERLDQVPLVDSSIIAAAPSVTKVVQKDKQSIMQVEGNLNAAWPLTYAALKRMGMTVNKGNKATGIIEARDRSLLSDPASPVGRLINRSFGRINKGEEYKFLLAGDNKNTTIEVMNKLGKALPAAKAQSILARLRKGYVSK